MGLIASPAGFRLDEACAGGRRVPLNDLKTYRRRRPLRPLNGPAEYVLNVGRGVLMPRRWISILALVGMLLHSAFAVRHHDMMTSMQIAAADRASSVLGELTRTEAAGVLCKTPRAESVAGHPDGSRAPHCPCCITASADTAVLVDGQLAAIVLPAVKASHVAERDQRFDVIRKLRPPSRAPPTTA